MEPIDLTARGMPCQDRVEAIAGLGSWHLDLTTNRLRLSQQAARIAGLDGLLQEGHEALLARVPEPERTRVANAWLLGLAGAGYEVDYPLDLGHELRWVWERAEFERDDSGRARGAVGVLQDVSGRRGSEKEALAWANRDPLTGLPNRAQLNSHLHHALTLARRHRRRLALLFIDLDRFKQVNDNLGHAYGDLLLRQVSDRITADLRESDLLARLGGDEFMVVLEDLDEDAQAGIVAKKLVETLTRPFRLDGREASIGASIGIALYPDDGEDEAALLRHADLAMYRAKASGRSTLCFFSPELNDLAAARQRLEAGLRDALRGEGLALMFQPRAGLGGQDGPPVVETQLRWRHPDQGLLDAGPFLADAEETDLAADLVRWTVTRACHHLAEWRARGLDLRLSVNVPGRLIPEDLTLAWVAASLAQHGVPAGRLVLGIPQAVLLGGGPEADHWLKSARALGLGLCLDDFGAGQISVERLHQLPFETVKLHRDLLGGPVADPLLRALVGLARNLGLGVVAQGVDAAGDLDRVRELGCQAAQGACIAPPLAAGALPGYFGAGAVAR